MRKTIGIVFAGGRVEDLSVLTEHRPKAAVVFGGIYRTIDFALTNLAAAGIAHVGVCCINMDQDVQDETVSTIFETVAECRSESNSCDVRSKVKA